MSLRIIYIPQDAFQWESEKQEGSDGCLYWYFNKEDALKAFPDSIIEESEFYFPEPWENN